MWYLAFSEFSSEWWQHGDLGFRTIESGLKFQTCSVMDNSGDFFFLSSVSVQFSHSVMSNSLRPRELQHTRLACPSPTPGVYSNSCPSSRWCHPTISSFVVPFSSCLQSLPASGCFPMSQFFASGGQSIGASASASVLPVDFQDWFPLGLTGWISLQSKGLSRVFSNANIFFKKQCIYF